MTPDELFADFQRGFEGRRFSAGLLVAIDVDSFKLGDISQLGFREILSWKKRSGLCCRSPTTSS